MKKEIFDFSEALRRMKEGSEKGNLGRMWSLYLYCL